MRQLHAVLLQALLTLQMPTITIPARLILPQSAQMATVLPTQGVCCTQAPPGFCGLQRVSSKCSKCSSSSCLRVHHQMELGCWTVSCWSS